MSDPKTPHEWQDAADQAEFFLSLDSARQYGLVETDLRVDCNRCVEILRRAKELGISPAKAEETCRRMLEKGAASCKTTTQST